MTLLAAVVLLIWAVVQGGPSGAVGGGGTGQGGAAAGADVGRSASEQPAGDRVVPELSGASREQKSSVRIASWNIEWLGNPDERSGASRGVAQDPSRLAEAIRRSQASVLALQEISPTASVDPPRSRELDAIVRALGPADRWRYVLFPSRSGDQFTGFLWDSARLDAVEEAGELAWRVPVPARRSSQGSGLWVRPPYAMKFSAGTGRTDFVLINVHMKADYRGDFAVQRDEEASTLASLLADVRRVFQDADIAILGDTNMVSATEPAGERWRRAGLRDLNDRSVPTHWREGAMDRIFVGDQPEFASSTFKVIDHTSVQSSPITPSEFKHQYSDHFLVWTTIELRADDD